MAWLIPSLIATLSGTLVLTFVYFYLYAQDREKYLGIWAWGWGIYALRFIFQLGIQLGVGPPTILNIANQAVSLISGVFLMWGIFILLQNPLPLGWLIGAAIGLFWIVFATLADISFMWQTLPVFIFLAAIYVWTGVIFLRLKNIEGLSHQVTGWAFIVWGIHKLNFPFLQPVLWFAPWGYLLAAVLEFVVALGIILIYFQKTRQDLSQSEARYRSLVEFSPLPIFVHQDGQFVYVNPAAAKLFGTNNTAKLIGRALIDFVHSDFKVAFRQYLTEARESSNQIRQGELKIIRLDQQVVDLEMSAMTVPFGDDEAHLIICDDVSERKRTEAALSWEAQVNAAIAELSRILLTPASIEDVSFLVLDYAKDLSMSPFGFIGYVDLQTGHLVCPTMSREIWDNCQVNEEDIVFKEFKGLWGWVLNHRESLLSNTPAEDERSTGIPAGHLPVERFLAAPALIHETQVGIVALANSEREYTKQDLFLVERLASLYAIAIQRTRAEAEIRRRNRELDLLNRIIEASAADMEPGSILEIACRQLARTFDVPQVAALLLDPQKTEATIMAEYVAQNHSSLLNRIIQVRGRPSLEQLLEQKAPLVVADAPNDPRLVPIQNLIRERGAVSILLLPLIIEGQVVGSLTLEATETRLFTEEEVNLAWNATEQVAGALARTWLNAERRLLSAAIEQAAESVIITDTTGTILYVNPAFEQITGYTRNEIIGQSTKILDNNQQNPVQFEELWATIQAGNVWYGRFINKRKDGRLYTEEATITPVFGENGKIINYVSTQRDVTRELELEEQYRQAQKMEAIGQLAAGIAHDFNNLLTSMTGFAELTLMYKNISETTKKNMGHIIEQGQRAAHLVHQILDFSRKTIRQPQLLDLEPFINETIKFLKRTIPEHIGIVLESDSLDYQIYADPTQIQQMITNLAVNARDAMPEGGTLKFGLSKFTLTPGMTVSCMEMKPGDWVVVTISDTGTGMPPEVQHHLFEPFFSTKGHNGTGLGLAQVYGIVKQHEGCVEVHSQPGEGTSFVIYLPAAVGNKQEKPTPSEPLPLGDSETILLVEDESAVLEVGKMMLEKLGYRVLAVDNAKTALTKCETHRDKIALVLTDMVMPEMDGFALCQALKAQWPQIRVVIMSGYPLGEKTEQMPAGIAGWLQKPLTLADLARTIKQALYEPQP